MTWLLVGPMFDLKHLPKSLSLICWITTHRLNIWVSKRRCQCVSGNSVPSGSYLVCVHQSGMWKVERGDEQTDTLALHPVTVQVIGDDPGHKVLAGAGPAMQGQGQRLVGLRVVDKTLDGFQNHRLSQVLPVELHLKVLGQTCMCERECLKKAGA